MSLIAAAISMTGVKGQGYVEFHYSYGFVDNGVHYAWGLPDDVYFTLNDMYRYHDIVDVSQFFWQGVAQFEVVLHRNGAFLVAIFDRWGQLTYREALPYRHVAYYRNLYRNRRFAYRSRPQVNFNIQLPPRVVYVNTHRTVRYVSNHDHHSGYYQNRVVNGRNPRSNSYANSFGNSGNTGRSQTGVGRTDTRTFTGNVTTGRNQRTDTRTQVNTYRNQRSSSQQPTRVRSSSTTERISRSSGSGSNTRSGSSTVRRRQ